jgi:HlyD family secretion protein
MTATATVETRRAKQVVAVRNAALRFEPAPPEALTDKATPAMPRDTPPAERPRPGQGRVFIEGNGPPSDPGATALLVDVGITDGVWTEIKKGLSAGSRVIVDERTEEKKRGFRLF